MTILRLSRTATYILESDGFFSVAETRELSTWMQGLTVIQSASANNVSPDTVKTHRRSIREKTGKRSGVGVMAFCLASRFIRPAKTYHTYCNIHPQLALQALDGVKRGVRHG